jgi:type II secretory ATPase GspE/PulE/Tfp pilus assembly ATPase PilB-like protein
MSETPKRKLGDILVERGFISEEQLQAALSRGKRVGEALLDMGALTADELNWALSELLGIPYVEFREDMVDLALARTMPEELLRRHLAFPVLRVDQELTVIMADPTNRRGIDALEAASGAKVVVAIAAREAILHLLDRAFPPPAARAGRVQAEVEVSEGAADSDAAGRYAFLMEGLKNGAAEIHLEPMAEELRVWHRVDGRLSERTRLPRAALGQLLSRTRTLAGLTGTSAPCRTSRRTRLGGQALELEFVFFPTLHGEGVTVRVWRGGVELPTLETLALEGTDAPALARLAAGRGLVFVSGSDPRARAALLYACARAVAGPDHRVLTVERAVSFVVPEFVQVELPGEFEPALATTLDQPADVVVVEGLEGRDACLAAIRGAAGGGLVLAGLAAPTRAFALARLAELGVAPALLLGETRALLHVERRDGRHHVEVLAMTDELRDEFLRGGWVPWTSRIS